MGAPSFSQETTAVKPIIPFPTETRTLANGLKVIVMPMPSDGLVAYWTVVRTGSRDEYEAGHTGFAHFFEHMMFRGTDRFPAEEYNRIVTTIGADTNAYTTDDHTAYHFTMAAEDLERVMELESDRFQNLKYAESAFQTEAGAVYGEYRKDRTEPRLHARRATRGHRVRKTSVRPHDDGLRARHRRDAEDVRLLAHVLRALLPARQRGAVHRRRRDTGAGVPARREVLRPMATRLRAAADSGGARAEGRTTRRRAVRRPDAAADARRVQAAGLRPRRQIGRRDRPLRRSRVRRNQRDVPQARARGAGRGAPRRKRLVPPRPVTCSTSTRASRIRPRSTTCSA